MIICNYYIISKLKNIYNNFTSIIFQQLLKGIYLVKEPITPRGLGWEAITILWLKVNQLSPNN